MVLAVKEGFSEEVTFAMRPKQGAGASQWLSAERTFQAKETSIKVLPNPRKESILGAGGGAGWEGCPPASEARAYEPGAPHRVCVFLAECLLQPVPRKGDSACGAVGQWEELLRQHPGELLPPGRGSRAAGWEAHQRL